MCEVFAQCSATLEQDNNIDSLYLDFNGSYGDTRTAKQAAHQYTICDDTLQPSDFTGQ